MASYWILKTEPSSYSFADLQRERRARWDGVTNPVALKHLRSMHRGDPVLVYHTGDEKRIVGRATVAGEPYPDPKAGDERIVVVDLEAGEPVPTPVTLAQVKADPVFAELALVRQGRLSVIPVPEPMWKRLLGMAGVTG
ncbi:MAG TPA: EVE domain-containing protein [Gemmatimonadales bacterium]|nr:EVE domain-containing protein [Gemmatimonadales bacterium]